MSIPATPCSLATHPSREYIPMDRLGDAGRASAEGRERVTDRTRAVVNPLRTRLRSDGGIEKWPSAYPSIPLTPACPPLRCGRLHGVPTCLPGVPATRKG